VQNPEFETGGLRAVLRPVSGIFSGW